MADYKVIGAVDETLKTLLWSFFQADGTITGIPPILASDSQVTFDPPFRLIQNIDPDQNLLSIFLYRVAENAEMKNQPLTPSSNNRLRYPPLCLNLYYLITPMTNSSDNDHKLLGKTLQVFHDHAVLTGSLLVPLLRSAAEELRIILDTGPLEDLTKLWSAFLRPYRLSVSYTIKIVFIDSELEAPGEPVRRKRLEFEQKRDN